MDAKNYTPAFGFGAKVFPQNLAFSNGIPLINKVIYIDGVNGADSGRSGRSFKTAYASLYKAHDAVTTDNYDMIIVAPAGTGSGSGTNESAALTGGLVTFSKSLVSVVGAPAPTRVSPRARILWDTASQSTTTVALLTISGSGNRFVNIQLGTFVDNNVLCKVTGDRNYFGAVHFAGIGDATAGDDADAKSLWLSDADENMFDGCYIGLDTIARSTSNVEIEIDGPAQRNTFKDCIITGYADDAGHLFVRADTAQDMDRHLIFDHCFFINPIASAATTMTVAMALTASLGGAIILSDSWLLGATDWADNFANVYTAGNMLVATAATSGLMAVAS